MALGSFLYSLSTERRWFKQKSLNTFVKVHEGVSCLVSLNSWIKEVSTLFIQSFVGEGGFEFNRHYIQIICSHIYPCKGMLLNHSFSNPVKIRGRKEGQIRSLETFLFQMKTTTKTNNTRFSLTQFLNLIYSRCVFRALLPSSAFLFFFAGSSSGSHVVIS